MDPQELTGALSGVRGMCGGDRIRRLPSKAQKLASVKGEEEPTTFPHPEKRATIAPAHTPG
jgi:hypothetical protein